jgi:hypothetical protein
MVIINKRVQPSGPSAKEFAESSVHGYGIQRNDTAGTCTTTKQRSITHKICKFPQAESLRKIVKAKKVNRNTRFCSETQTRVVKKVSIRRNDHFIVVAMPKSLFLDVFARTKRT